MVQQAKTEAFQQALEKLDLQAHRIRSLEILLAKTLAEAPKATADQWVVRSRPARVRSEPESGSPVEGSLLPNEVVRVLRKRGKWVEIEYYHWFHEEYRTGWVLKKYLERVPHNYSATQNGNRP
ncbi:SH3 domain-containing protein [Solimonas sp. SE-A11]|uniref:SH3 domain-containing protein n=1 Tax=Solimonas sp. SE-A11 TaxID=3054954 RepID=UPI00259D315B|nr:SH3 domain-containing protein [Solimonas sp. SE-A11]MDM4769042.1 SH3 domain-containing protein [Solimonas sp. SE-A11]